MLNKIFGKWIKSWIIPQLDLSRLVIIWKFLFTKPRGNNDCANHLFYGKLSIMEKLLTNIISTLKIKNLKFKNLNKLKELANILATKYHYNSDRSKNCQ